MTIHLERMSPCASRDQPGRQVGNGPWALRPAPPLFGLAPGGVYRAAPVAGRAVRSCRTVSPLLRTDLKRSVFCGTIPGVAPAGRYPAPYLHGARTFLPGRLKPSKAVIRPAGPPEVGARRRSVNPAMEIRKNQLNPRHLPLSNSRSRANPAKVEDFGDKDLLRDIDLARILFGEVIPLRRDAR